MIAETLFYCTFKQRRLTILCATCYSMCYNLRPKLTNISSRKNARPKCIQHSFFHSGTPLYSYITLCTHIFRFVLNTHIFRKEKKKYIFCGFLCTFPCVTLSLSFTSWDNDECAERSAFLAFFFSTSCIPIQNGRGPVGRVRQPIQVDSCKQIWLSTFAL